MLVWVCPSKQPSQPYSSPSPSQLRPAQVLRSGSKAGPRQEGGISGSPFLVAIPGKMPLLPLPMETQ